MSDKLRERWKSDESSKLFINAHSKFSVTKKIYLTLPILRA